MKVTSFVVNLCSVFVLLTLGSLLTIIAFHVVDYQDVIASLNMIYQQPLRMFQMGALGLLMIVLGLAFAKTLIKMTDGSALLYESGNGQVRITSEAIQESIRKSLRKYTVIKDQKIKISIDDQHIQAKVRLVLWVGVEVAQFVRTLQEELHNNLSRLLGSESQIYVTIDVVRVASHEPDTVMQE